MFRFLRGVFVALSSLLSAAVGLVLLLALLLFVFFATEDTDTGGDVRIASLTGEVSVIRDAYGVPHIFADNRLDAYRALGFVHAQDRFFQMEFMRRIAAGRLSEVVGRFGLRADRFMRLLGVYRLAEASVEALSPEARESVDAYVEGVNAWLTHPDTERPAELVVLGIRPEPWRAADSAAWVRLMAILLSADWRTELLRARLSSSLDADRLEDLWPDEPAAAPTTVVEARLAPAFWKALAAAIPDLFPRASASNAWAVAGARSASGKPLLASDPHLGLSAPGMWHLARIVTPEFSASGGALPGQPFFMVGQNGYAAWGLTTTHSDTQDLFVERIDPEDPERYLTPEGSAPFGIRFDEIRVRWRDEPERLRFRTTRHGPVISDISPDANALADDGTVVALAFAALREDDRTGEAVYRMNVARTSAEFRAALRDFHAPMQNVVYAHIDGSIGFVTAGRLPVRPGGPGRQPVPGWTGAHDWDGFVAFEDMPQLRNPGSGQIVNANNRVAPKSYPHPISNDWPAGFRAERIEDLLDTGAPHSLDEFAAFQTDIRSLGARALTEAMLANLDTPDAHRDIVEMMRTWNGDMAVDRPEPLIYAAWSQATRERMIDDELGEDAVRYRGIDVRALVRMLTARPVWCDDIATSPVESCAEIVAAALDDAVARLSDAYGEDHRAWRWGESHRVTFAHPLMRFLGPVSRLFAPQVATAGGDHSINRGTWSASGGSSFAHVHGAGMRALFDMAAPDETRYIVAPGQSGKLASPHFDDLAVPWARDEYIVLKGDLETLRARATAELTLRP